eukprot:Plantae.Rhodophyta-Hildenbrandia_rubra.ctg3642.p1 GENE.Plantae.Rhodophyta-Hildenbrandia_rubra.ctg3642~~Plantae.Rhodophyta-Hildenbrandia_rubra.ctg3642.p1  ORF type:complete len:447 (+),score=129.71 Plantae.Rhodophyta-Hildenbrandia_rubra.ctg3642:1973-3313(+)
MPHPEANDDGSKGDTPADTENNAQDKDSKDEPEMSCKTREELAGDVDVEDPEDMLAKVRGEQREIVYRGAKKENGKKKRKEDEFVEVLDMGTFNRAAEKKGREEDVVFGEDAHEEEEEEDGDESETDEEDTDEEDSEDEDVDEGQLLEDEEDVVMGKGKLVEIKESTDVMQANARYFMMDDVVCKNCGLKGHLSYDCTEEEEEKRCFGCGMPGHDARDCPNEACFYCGELGHRQRDCETKKEDFKNGRFRRTAAHNRSGVKLRRIEQPRTNMRIYCYVCGQDGHLDCSLDAAPPALLSCYNCGKVDHTGAECTEPTVDEMVHAVNELEREEKRVKASVQRKKEMQKGKSPSLRTRKVSIISTKPKKTIDKKAGRQKMMKTKKKKKKEERKELTKAEQAAKRLEEQERSREWLEQLNEIVKVQKSTNSNRRDPRRDPRDRSPMRRRR